MATPDRAVEGERSIDLQEGLGSVEAAARLARVGPNELPRTPRPNPARRLLRQLREPMALLLLVAAGVASFALGETVDALAIAAIVVLNAFIALGEEGKASRALEALERLQSPMATVVREGRQIAIPAREVVPGDVVLLAGGDRVPADVQLIDAASLEIDESLLTGESLPVEKQAHPGNGPDETASAFTGTVVTSGSARGLVTATGSQTRLGTIAGEVSAEQPPTPLQKELSELTAKLGVIALATAAGVFLLEVALAGRAGSSLRDAFFSSVARAVAAVPEGLATVVAVALALGVRRMAKRGAIVRDLPSVETLGATTLILTDKTGTLTENRMRLGEVALPGRASVQVTALSQETVPTLAEVAALCNDASLDPPAGDPLEIALLEAVGARRVAALLDAHPRVATLPFDSARRFMATLHAEPGGSSRLLLVKGAPEPVLARCRAACRDGGDEYPLHDLDRAPLLNEAAAMAERGIRVLALARRRLPSIPAAIEDVVDDLVLVGLVGLIDPVRPEAADAVASSRAAGIKVVMVTGDHPGTGRRVAMEVGLGTGDALRVAVGRETKQLAEADVYARVQPEDKLALVEAYRSAGEVVAVTGDGVNDAPALRRADIGVAMGRSGSDAARESANLVITDDNLATVVAAVREGRGIYANVRRVVEYLIAANLSEVLVMVGGLLAFPQLGVPLLPLQLLWINLITDGLPALALGVRPVDPGVMAQRPRPKSERLLTGRRLRRLGIRGAVMGCSALGALAVSRFLFAEPWEHARALLFATVAFSQLAYAVVVHRPDPGGKRAAAGDVTGKPVGGINVWLPIALALGVVLQVAVLVWPPAQSLFHTAPLGAREWLLVLVAATIPAVLITTINLRSRPG